MVRTIRTFRSSDRHATPSAAPARPAAAAGVVLGSLLALAGAVTPSYADAAPADRLSVTVEGTGDALYDGRTYSLECGPTGGDHPLAAAACDRLTEVGRPFGQASGPLEAALPDRPGTRDKATASVDPFAPVPGDALCTMQYGGAATARITGTWHGQPVDATFSRSDGCEIGRWDTLQPLLPAPQGV